MRRYAFLDSQVYLHYRMFDEIDWPSLLEADEVVIVVPRTITKELDKQKNIGRSRAIRDKAKKVLRKLLPAISESKPIRPSVTVERFRKTPTVDFEAHELEREWADHYLIATVLTYRDEFPAREVVLVSGDSNARLDAADLGIRVAEPPVDDVHELLAAEEKEIRALKRQVERYRAAVPKLRLETPDGSNLMEFSYSGSAQLTEAEIRNEIKRLRRGFGNIDPNALAFPSFSYPQRIEKYLSSYEEYLREKAKYEEAMTRVFDLPINLRNGGSAEAKQIDVILMFPQGVKAAESWNLPDPPQEPKRPSRNLTAMGLMGMESFPVPFKGPSVLSRLESNVKGPVVIESGRKVEYRISHLNPEKVETLNSLAAVFLLGQEIVSFGIEYEIYAEGLLGRESGRLDVRIVKDPSG